jgi:hypothetical protein
MKLETTEIKRTVHYLRRNKPERDHLFRGNTQHTSVYDLVLYHSIAGFRSFLLIYPVGLIPVVVRYQTILCLGIGQFRGSPAKVG